MKRLSPLGFFRGLKNILSGKIHMPEELTANETLNTLLSRRTVRKFEEREIPEEVMNVILEAGRVAPCGVNLQSWSFGVYNQNQWKETFGTPMPFLGSRAVLVLADMHRMVVTMDEFPFKPLAFYTISLINASIASYAMNIAAEACGVSSVMLSETGKSGFYDAKYLKEKLKLPDGVYPVMTIVFGYGKGGEPPMPPKLPLEEITFTGTYREPDDKVMKNWLEQMMAGYRASRVTKSFKGQLNHYLEKMDEAEKDLKDIIFYKDEEKKKSI